MDASQPARKRNGFQEHVRADATSAFPAERGRYHLYISHACPYSARTVLVRCVKQLQDVVSMSALDPGARSGRLGVRQRRVMRIR